VPMVGHGAEANKADPGLACGEGQAIDEGVVGFSVGPHEESALGAVSGDQVATTRDDGAREAHAQVVG
jgi:hypothetical protein